MKTLPPVEGKAPGHKLGFPFNIRRGARPLEAALPERRTGRGARQRLARKRAGGQYLVEGPGHCGECHTPRQFTGGLKKDQWLAGAVAAEGEGIVPNITSGEGGIGGWSRATSPAPRNWFHAGFRYGRRRDGRGAEEHGRTEAGGPRRDRDLSQGCSARPNGYPARRPETPEG